MAFDKETAKTANKFYTNGKGMYMLLFDTYSVITSGNSEGPTDDVYLKTESGNPVGAEWKDAVTNEPVSLTISAGATPIPFTGLVKLPEGAISIDKGSSIELSVQPQPADTTDSITYNWSVDDAYLSYSLNNNKCIITGVAAGSTTVTVTPVVNGTADASKAVSFATTVNVVVPTISIGSPDIASQKWQVGTAVSLDLVSHMSISASEGSLVFEAFECPAGITVSSSGIVSGTPAEDASGSILINVYVEGFRSDTIKSINLAYSIDAAAPTLTVSDPITPVQSWQATVAISSVNLMTLCGISTSDGSTPKFTSAYVPAGLTLSSNGILSGTPSSSTGPESFQVTVCIPGFEEETTKYIAVNYVIAEAPPTLYYITTSVTMPEMTAGTEIQSYSIIDACQLSTSNGTAVMFDVMTELPAGLSLNNGIITGTPVSENSGSFELYAYPQGYRNNGVSIGVSYVINEAQGGGDTPSEVISYKVTCKGFTGDFAKYAGTYSQTNSPATGTEAVYKSENGCIMKWLNSTWGWSFMESENSSYPDIITYEGSDNPVNANNKSNWWNEYTCVYIPTGKIELVSSGESGGDTPSEVISYKVTCKRFTGDFAKYAGTYSQTNSPATGTEAVYKNENNCYMYQHGSGWGWVFSSSEGGYPDIITYEVSDNPVNANNKGYWWDEYNLGNIPTGKIELVSSGESGGESGDSGSGEGGDDSGTSNADYIVSGAGTEVVNGDYYDSGITKNDRPVYVNVNDNVMLWYFKLAGFWTFTKKDDYSAANATMYYYCEQTGEVPTGDWGNASSGTGSLGSTPMPTVTQG